MNPVDVEAERAAKQNFLVSEIMDQGYDTNAFAIFLENVKENGSDIDVWTLEELREQVAVFKKNNVPEPPKKETEPVLDSPKDQPSPPNVNNEETKPPVHEEHPPEPDNQEEMKVGQEQEMKKSHEEEEKKQAGPPANQPKKSSSGAGKKWIYEYYKEVPSRGIEQNEYAAVNKIKIEVYGFEKKPGWLFSSGYTNFLVRTLPQDVSVKRKREDFVFLAEYLTRMLPGVFVPSIPYKKDTEDSAKIRKDMQFLQKFLISCLYNETIRTTFIFRDFLTLETSQWEAKVREKKKAEGPLRYDQYYNPTGQNILCLSTVNFHYGEQVSPYITEGDQIYRNLKKLSNELLKDLDNVTRKYGEIADQFAQLAQLAKSNAKFGTVAQLDTVGRQYIELNNFFADLGEIQKKNTTLISDNLVQYFNYTSFEIQNLKEYFINRTQYQQEYLKERDRLRDKKERLLIEAVVNEAEKPRLFDLSLAEINRITNSGGNDHQIQERLVEAMLPKENEVLKKYKEKTAFHNQKFMCEMDRFLEYKAFNTAKNFEDFIKQLARIETQKQSVAVKLYDVLSSPAALMNDHTIKKIRH